MRLATSHLRSATRVFPVMRFPFRHPFQSGLQPPFAGLLSLCFGHPFHVLLFVAVTKLVECRVGFFVPAECSSEIRGNEKRFSFLRRSAWSGFHHAGILQFGGLLDVAG